jgi:hypothetical protein
MLWRSFKEILIMKKNCLFTMALLSLALAVSCAKGGNGVVPPQPSVTVVSNFSSGAIYPTQNVTLTATVANSSNTAVTWSLSGPGTLTPVTPAPNPATATYVAPATAGSQATVTATLVSDSAIANALTLDIVDITTEVAPTTLSVGSGLMQQLTVVAVPDYAPQTFTWNCTAGGSVNGCGTFSQDSSVSGLAYYTANDNCSGNCVQISALTPLDSTGCSTNPNYCTIAKISLVKSRVNGTYTFQFSGYDSSNHATAVVGTFTASNGTITSGVEEQLTSSGMAPQSITGGTYTPTPVPGSNPPVSLNSTGALTLTLPMGVYPNTYQLVLNGAGDLEMIESDTNGTGSGTAQISSSAFTGTVAQTYAFGFTGVDSNGKRVGYAGLMGFNGQLTGTPPTGGLSGLMDVNDGGQSSNSVCSGTPPCTITGTYTSNSNGSWHLALTSPVKMGFDFFVAGGTTGANNPLTLYAISTDPVTTNPAVSGTMVLQDSSQTYNNAAFKGNSVSALTGVSGANTNVSLTWGTTDGNGDFSGVFDQNDAGTILSAIAFPSESQSPSPYTYAASSSSNGRYIFQMLGNPSASTVVAPLPFVLYASGKNRGFLLDQSSSSVMTGTMNPQGNSQAGIFSGSELAGVYAAATKSSGNSAVDPIAANLLLTWANTGTCTSECVNGTLYDSASPTGATLAAAYTLQDSGYGAIAPVKPATTPNYAIYVLDTLGCNASAKNPNPVCAIQSFVMIDEDTTNPNPSIIFAKE